MGDEEANSGDAGGERWMRRSRRINRKHRRAGEYCYSVKNDGAEQREI